MKTVRLSFVAAATFLSAAACHAAESGIAGKTVVFVPTALGYDLTDGWNTMVGQKLIAQGVRYSVRDPNWKTDAGAQAITSLISEKPDLMLVQNPDIQSYAKLLKRAEAAGIPVVQVNMRSTTKTTAFIGADWVGIGEAMANVAVERCGAGTSGKISLVQGTLTSASSAYQLKGIQGVLAKHPEIKIVSNQAADWDASKARAVTDTAIKQNPDLCAVLGFWDGQDTGVSAAVKEAGRQGKILVVTNGGAAQSACDNVANGTFDEYMTYNVKEQSEEIIKVVNEILGKGIKPGAASFEKVSPVNVINKKTLQGTSCWNLAEYKK